MTAFQNLLALAIIVAGAHGPGAAFAAEPAKPARPAVSREQAADICTHEPRAQWLPEAEMRLLAEFRGYRITTFKIANGSCYEVYGFKDGRIVEAYFDPVTSKLVRQNVAK